MEPEKLLDGYWNEAELAAQLNRTIRTMQRWRALRIGPPVTWVGKTPYYNLDSGRKWLLSQERKQVRAPKKRRRRVAAIEAAE